MTVLDSGHRRLRNRSGRVAATLFISTLCVVVAGVALPDRVPAPVSVSTQARAERAAPACGSDLPARLNIPAGYVGPGTGSAPLEHEAEQLARAWSSPTGRVEVRWPSDLDKRPFTESQGFMGMTSAEPIPAAGGTSVRYMLFHLPGQQVGCETLQISVFDADVARLNATVEEISFHPFQSDAPLVTVAQTAERAPAVASCAAPQTVAAAPNRGSAVAGPTGATPTEALERFLATQPALLRDGYVEFGLPDGSKAYGNTGAGSAFITVVHVAPAGSTWAVDKWEAAGC